MREILFRGKRKDNGEWVYGSLLKQAGEYISKDEIAPNECWICGMRGEMALIAPETIGQYTGIKDKNGKKIFEGDIVRYVIVDIDGSEDAYIGAICFEPEKVGFAIKRDDYRAFFVNSWLIDIEVIGNIYDNPELLGGGKHEF